MIPLRVVPGSCCMEALLWIFFLLPGMLYSVWRIAATKRVCRECGSTNFIPLDTPRGRALLMEVQRKEELGKQEE